MCLKYGTAHPDKVDFIGLEDGICNLWIVQSERLNENNLLLLQEKINNYLAFILDGQMAEEFPHMSGLPKLVKIVLQYDATGISAEFLERVSTVFRNEGIGFQYGTHESL